MSLAAATPLSLGIYFLQNITNVRYPAKIFQATTGFPAPGRIFLPRAGDVLGTRFTPEVFEVDYYDARRAGAQECETSLQNGAGAGFRLPQEPLFLQASGEGGLHALTCPAFLSHSFRVRQPQIFSFRDVRALPESGEGRHVVGVQAGHGVTGDTMQPGTIREFIVEDIHSPETVPGHGRPDVRRDDAQVFPDDDRLVPARLQGQYRVKLPGVIADVNAPPRVQGLRYPEKPVQAHDVVDT